MIIIISTHCCVLPTTFLADYDHACHDPSRGSCLIFSTSPIISHLPVEITLGNASVEYDDTRHRLFREYISREVKIVVELIGIEV